MPVLTMTRRAFQAMRFLIMVPFVFIFVLLDVATGAQRSEQRIHIGKESRTFVIVGEIQRQDISIQRRPRETIWFLIMAPVILGTTLLNLAIGAQRTEQRIHLDGGSHTFVFAGEIQRRFGQSRSTELDGLKEDRAIGDNLGDVGHDEEVHAAREGHQNEEDGNRGHDQDEDRDYVEEEYHDDEEPHPANERVDSEEGLYEEEDGDRNEGCLVQNEPRPDEPASSTGEPPRLPMGKGIPENHSNIDSIPGLRLLTQSPQLTLRAGRVPYMEPLISHSVSFSFDDYLSQSDPFNQENQPPVMANTAVVNENRPSQFSFQTSSPRTRKEMPFAVMQSDVFDLKEDRTDTDESGLEI